MNNKEKVLAKWPGAYCVWLTWKKHEICKPNGVALATGPTESEAWSNAAKVLE